MLIGQQLAWIFSIISNCLWLFVFIPQLYQNYKNKSSHAISLLLLFCLLLGDILAMTSGYLKKLNIVVIYTAAYHIILNLIITSQILYYRYMYYVYRDSSSSISSSSNSSSIGSIGSESGFSSEDDVGERTLLLSSAPTRTLMWTSTWKLQFYVTGICFIVLTQIFLILIINNKYNIEDTLAWIATFIFIFSRIPQIMLNFKRKSTEGLSLATFIIAYISNMFFMLSILIILYDLNKTQYNNYLIGNIQWIIGGNITTIFDCIIFYQFYIYRRLYL